jgi:hypothetical protein
VIATKLTELIFKPTLTELVFKQWSYRQVLGPCYLLAADILNIHYRTDLKMSPHQKLFGSRPDVSKCQPFDHELLVFLPALRSLQDR